MVQEAGSVRGRVGEEKIQEVGIVYGDCLLLGCAQWKNNSDSYTYFVAECFSVDCLDNHVVQEYVLYD